MTKSEARAHLRTARNRLRQSRLTLTRWQDLVDQANVEIEDLSSLEAERIDEVNDAKEAPRVAS